MSTVHDIKAQYQLGTEYLLVKWDSSLPPDQAAQAAREEPVFKEQPMGTFVINNPHARRLHNER